MQQMLETCKHFSNIYYHHQCVREFA